MNNKNYNVELKDLAFEYLNRILEVLHKKRIAKPKQFIEADKKIILTKIYSIQKLTSEIRRCKEFINKIENEEIDGDLNKWYEFLEIKSGAKIILIDELKEIYNIELSIFEIKTGLINPFDIIPDLV